MKPCKKKKKRKKRKERKEGTKERRKEGRKEEKIEIEQMGHRILHPTIAYIVQDDKYSP